ncbi:MAG: triose-phosphate isomerase [Flavobacteriaceae bacterium]|jgi:triosephosphate isomerase|nr:triose-phosphate isomerase [Flavobacteriaceae bacterium]
MRRKIVAGNWKMNKTLPEAKLLLTEIDTYIQSKPPKCEVIVGIPFVYIESAKANHKDLNVFSEDISEHRSGAYTGEVSAEMLKSIHADGAIIGHSERRQYHKETDEQIGAKVKIALDNGLTPIFCNGEVLEERKSGRHKEVVKRQTEVALFGLSPEDISKVIIAYEPVWAIGTGETATPEQAQEIHAYIRGLIATQYGNEIADSISILYGGSVKPSNAKEIFSKPDVDGGLIGGAALNINDFSALIDIYSEI